LSVAAIGIFSAYMLYDLKQILDGGETNYNLVKVIKIREMPTPVMPIINTMEDSKA